MLGLYTYRPKVINMCTLPDSLLLLQAKLDSDTHKGVDTDIAACKAKIYHTRLELNNAYIRDDKAVVTSYKILESRRKSLNTAKSCVDDATLELYINEVKKAALVYEEAKLTLKRNYI